MCVCVIYLLGNKPLHNLMALNNDNIYVAHKPEVWPRLGGDGSFYFTVIWDSSKVGHWNHLKFHSFTCLVVDATCQVKLS